MKPHPRIRKTVKWGGAVVSVVLLAAWVGCNWWWVQWKAAGGGVVIVSAGRITVGDVGSGGSFSGWKVGTYRGALEWWYMSNWTGSVWWIDTPLWIPVVPTLLVTAAAWRMDLALRRRERMGKCAKCGYDRTGLALGAVCPECGAGV